MPPLLELHRAIRLLLQAHHYAEELGRNPWDFAVERSCLREAGLTNNDIRWLVYVGFVEQGLDGSEASEFLPLPKSGGRSVLHKKSCFILTGEGYQFAQELNRQKREPEDERSAPHPLGAFADPVNRQKPEPKDQWDAFADSPNNGMGCLKAEYSLTPRWDSHRRVLLFDRQVVKRFKVPAPNQEIVLATFEEEAWPVRIDDPLPQHVNIVAKQRLHDTITSLNRNQQNRLLRFFGDGSGEAVCWEIRQEM
jgi:hypothetical protein